MRRSTRSIAVVMAVGLALAGCGANKPDKAASSTEPIAVASSDQTSTGSAPVSPATSAAPAPIKSAAPKRPTSKKAPAAGKSDAQTVALLKSAGAKADAKGTARFSMVIKTEIAGQGPVTIASEGVSSLTAPINSRQTMNMEIDGQTIAIEALMTPQAMYYKYPEEMSKQLGGKAWVKMTFADLEKVAGVDLQQLVEQSEQSSPTAYLKTLVAAGDVTVVGKETIRGTATTHYTGTVSPEAITAAYTGKLKKQVATLLKQMGDSPAEIDVWIAADGLPRRMHQVMTLAGNETDIAMEFLSFGDKVDVRPPPAAQTTDFSALMSQQPAP